MDRPSRGHRLRARPPPAFGGGGHEIRIQKPRSGVQDAAARGGAGRSGAGRGGAQRRGAGRSGAPRDGPQLRVAGRAAAARRGAGRSGAERGAAAAGSLFRIGMTSAQWLGERRGVWQQRAREAAILVAVTTGLAISHGAGPELPLAMVVGLCGLLEQAQPGRRVPYLRGGPWGGLDQWAQSADGGEWEAQRWTGWRMGELRALMHALGADGRYLRVDHTSDCTLETAVLVFLARNHNAGSLHDLHEMFGGNMDQRRISMISLAFTEVVVHYSKPRLTASLDMIPDHKIRQYITAVKLKVWNKLAAADNPIDAEAVHTFFAHKPIWGWIDCTRRPIEKPSPTLFPGVDLQREFYSGFKRSHCILWQAIGTPDGLIAHLSEPMVGRRHDLSQYHRENIGDHLHNRFSTWGPSPPKIVGDPAYRYVDTAYVTTPIPDVSNMYPGSPEHAVCSLANRVYSSVRIAIEWNFGIILLKFRRWRVHKMQIGKGLDVKAYMACAFMTNCFNCASGGNEISQYYGLQPMGVSEYCLGLEWSPHHVY